MSTLSQKVDFLSTFLQCLHWVFLSTFFTQENFLTSKRWKRLQRCNHLNEPQSGNLAFMKICLAGTGARLSNISQIHLPAWRWWYAVMWLQVCLDDCWKTKFLAGNTESIYGWRDKMDPSYMIQSDSARRAQYPDTQQTVTFISDNGEHLALFYVRGT